MALIKTSDLKILSVAVGVIVVGIVVSCQLKQDSAIEYPKPMPDSVSMIFLPGVVSGDSSDFNSAFSPDGKTYYFSRRSNRQSDIFYSRLESGKWTLPEKANFNSSEYSEADPAFDRDGKLYFISNRPVHQFDSLPDYDIWYTTRLKSNMWSEPSPLTVVNTDSSEFYISFSKSGNLYFSSARAGGFGEEDLYVSRLSDGNYLPGENLGPIVNSIHSEYDPGISQDEKIVIFTSSGRDDSFGGADLYGSSRDSNEAAWRKVMHLQGVNTSSREFCSYFSSDSKYFFYSSDANIKWIGANHIRKQIEME